LCFPTPFVRKKYFGIIQGTILLFGSLAFNLEVTISSEKKLEVATPSLASLRLHREKTANVFSALGQLLAYDA